MATYSVNFWGSKPGTNDDCNCDEDFATLEEARACFNEPWSTVTPLMRSYYETSTAWLELDGPDVHEERENPAYKARRHGDDWSNEHAMQIGMGLGVDAYNDAMGY